MNREPRQAGMTLIELTFGLASLSMVGLAVGSLMVAAGNAWETRDDYVEQNVSTRAAAARIGEWVRQSRRVVSVAADGRFADVVLWADDANDPGNVNLNELKVITYDRVLNTLTLHAADASATQVMAPAQVGSEDFGPTFRGRRDVNAYPLAEGVVGFAATATNGALDGLSYRYLHVDMAMDSPHDADDQTAMIAAAVRAPDSSVDFLGETDGDGDSGGDSDGGLLSGLSVGLGTGVLGVNVEAAVDAGNDAPLASVFVETGGE